MAEWQFWIDVGGTFTDCLAWGPDGSLTTIKVLSSGIVKARLESFDDDGGLRVSGLEPYPRGFFDGYQARLAGDDGGLLVSSRVRASDPSAGVLELVDPLPEAGGPCSGGAVELSAGEPAPILAIRRSLGLGLDDDLGTIDGVAIDVRLGTTRATNALLERRGARTALVTTAGFGDLLRIGNQDRPRLFDLEIRKIEPLHDAVLEVDERVAADGSVVRPLDEQLAKEQLERLRADGVVSVAVCLLNSYRNPDHELAIVAAAQSVGFDYVTSSSQLSATQKIVPRADTAVLDAYLTPVLREYVSTIRAAMPAARLRLMTSAGGLVDADVFSGHEAILSGPAGGVVALAQICAELDLERVIGFDMGGTSTDVSRYSGELVYEYESFKAGVRIVAPTLAIETVAAGGGSVCDFDGQKLVVGPSSAGADPGPASYGRGGPLALTDINLYLGRLLPERFPFQLDREVVSDELERLRRRVVVASGEELSCEELAEGFVRIANANMAAAIQKISVARGYDLRHYTLVSFGGAGGQHACALASALGLQRVVVHPWAGILSAYGMGLADVKRFAVRSVLRPWDEETLARLEPGFEAMEEDLSSQILAEGLAASDLDPPLRRLELRYGGQSSAIDVSLASGADPRQAFEDLHRQLYGHAFEGREIEVAAMRVELRGRIERVRPAARPQRPHAARPVEVSRSWIDGSWQEVPVYDRQLLEPGARLEGPAIVVEPTSTTVLEEGWSGQVAGAGELLLEHPGVARAARSMARVHSVELELFNNRFAAIAEQMGAVLRRTSLSVNVKERLDFSCAVFTGEGSLVANAPHMPVHLGAMSETLRCLLEDVSELEAGDVLITNDPFRGGSHLPDLTLVTPVFDDDGEAPLFFTASRAHHADIGGICPGSMPPHSTDLESEGVLIRAFKVVRGGVEHFDELAEILSAARFPARRPDENLADVAAQIAANQSGVVALRRLMARHGREHTLAYMKHIQSAAEAKMRHSLAAIEDGVYRFEDSLDDGSTIAVSIDIRGDRAVLDFSGTAAPLETNLNANLAIVKAAVIYCFRCLIDEDIPLNDGVFAALEMRVPTSLLNPPSGDDPAHSPAVVGGNVETSQRVTDVILGALRLAAASQGTMNNLTFGDDEFGYYETLCGGAGAGPGFAGADAVHTHMTNTRLTDPEVLEARYPVRLLRFEVRQGSGGRGRFYGGNGCRRELEFLAPLSVSILSQRRTTRPFGLEGGAAGEAGRNTFLPVDGDPIDLGPIATVDARPGDRILIETPGGGGWGAAPR